MSYSCVDNIPQSIFKAGSDMHKLMRIVDEATAEIDERRLRIEELRNKSALTGLHLSNAGTVVRARRRAENEPDSDYHKIIDLENLRQRASGSIPDIISSLEYISSEETKYYVDEGYKYGMPGVLRILVGGDETGFVVDNKFVYAIENHAAFGIRYSALYALYVLQSEILLKTQISENGRDNTSALDNLQVFHDLKNWLNIDQIGVGDGSEPGGVLRPPQQSDTGLQNEIARVGVSYFFNADGGRSYLGSFIPSLGITRVNEIAAFNPDGVLIGIYTFPAIQFSLAINNDIMITEDYHG